MNKLIPVLSILALAVIALPISAQEHDNNVYLGELIADFDEASDKINQLAGAIPAELYGWRPTEGVRSVSEALMHVVGANYYISGALGHAGPEETPDESVADKDAVMAHLTASQEHVRQAVNTLASADLGETMQVFGQEMSRYRVLMIIAGHSHEHLGQMIAYARSNNIAPPWSGG